MKNFKKSKTKNPPNIFQPRRKLIDLVVFETKAESTRCILLFGNVLNEMLRAYTGNVNFPFNTFGLVGDEASGSWKSCQQALPERILM